MSKGWMSPGPSSRPAGRPCRPIAWGYVHHSCLEAECVSYTCCLIYLGCLLVACEFGVQPLQTSAMGRQMSCSYGQLPTGGLMRPLLKVGILPLPLWLLVTVGPARFSWDFALEDTELGNVCCGSGHGVFAGGCSRSSHVPTKPPSHIRLWFMVLLLMHALHKVGHGTGARVARTVKLAEMILFSALHAACVNDCLGVLSTTWPLQQALLAIRNVALKSSLAIVSCAFCRPHLPKVLLTP